MDYCLGDGAGGASMWTGKPAVDVDGDGDLDGIRLDFDGDGAFDDALADFDDDGLADHAALDFDDAAMADPCLDAGNLLAHLCLLGWQFPSRMDRVARARGAFERGLADSAIDYPKALLAAMECASLLRLVAIHRSGPDGARVARGLLLSATARLRAARLEAGSAGRPPRAGLASAAERRA